MAAALPVRSVAASRARRRHRLRILGFMSPWLVGVSLFFAYPLAATVYFSFFRYNLFQLTPVGLTNYRFLIHDPYAWTAIKNTLWLVVVLVPLRVLFGLGLAQLLTNIKQGGNVLRSIFYLPFLLPPVAAAVAFVFVGNPGTGPINEFAAKIGIHLPDWFNDPDWAKPGLALLA